MTEDEFKIAVVELTLRDKLFRVGRRRCPFYRCEGFSPRHTKKFAPYIFRSSNILFVACTNHVDYYLRKERYESIDFKDLYDR